MTKSFSDVASIYSNPGLLFQINPVMFLVYYEKNCIINNCEIITFVEFCKSFHKLGNAYGIWIAHRVITVEEIQIVTGE